MVRLFKFTLFFLLTLCLVGLAVANKGAIALFVPLSDYRVELPVYLLLFILFAAGFLFAKLCTFNELLQLRRKNKNLQKKLKLLEDEAKLLRNQKNAASIQSLAHDKN